MKALFSPAWVGSLVAVLVLATPAVRAQDKDLAAARELYASAAYEDALTALNRLRNTDHPPSQSPIIEQYRAFCLLALGRATDAEQAIEAVVTADPSFHPDNEVSPRLRTTFAEVRRRMLPVIIQQKYTQAKAAFDRKEYASAASGFSQVLATMADPDVSAEASRPPLSDMRVLAVCFQELSAKAAAPPPPPPVPMPIVPATLPPPPVAPGPPHIYTAEDRTVVPPLVVSQTLPSFRGISQVEKIGRIEVVIDETGAVESAMMTISVNNAYDKLAVAAARTWRYMPATVNGTPVKFRKVVQVTVRPTS